MISASSSETRQQAPALSHDAVVEHALTVADQDGLAAVSIRRIAQDFGVTPMALYWHVKNKDELLAAMGDRILDSVRVADDAGPVGVERMRGLLAALVTALRRHPGSTALAQMRVLMCPSGQQLAERALAILREAGFSVADSANLARAALQSVVTLVSGRPGAENAVPEPEREAVLAGKRAALAGLPVEQFPHIVECATALTDCPDEDAYYQAGIDLYLGGVAAMATQWVAAAG